MVAMRTAAQAYKEIKKVDPDTCISERQIRELMKSGQIPVIRIGRKLQVNMDVLMAYYENPEAYA